MNLTEKREGEEYISPAGAQPFGNSQLSVHAQHLHYPPDGSSLSVFGKNEFL